MVRVISDEFRSTGGYRTPREVIGPHGPSGGREEVIEAKVSRCFDEMVAIVSVGVDLDDSTTIVRDVAP